MNTLAGAAIAIIVMMANLVLLLLVPTATCYFCIFSIARGIRSLLPANFNFMHAAGWLALGMLSAIFIYFYVKAFLSNWIASGGMNY